MHVTNTYGGIAFMFLAIVSPTLGYTETLICTGSRICYDTLPCDAVENPELEYCRDRLTCDALDETGYLFNLDFTETQVKRRGPNFSQANYNILSKYFNEYTSDERTHYTLVAEPQSGYDFVSSILYLERRGVDENMITEFVTVDLSISPERGTTTLYGNCVLEK